MQNQIEKKEKNWILKSCDNDLSRRKIGEIADSLGINSIVAKLLYTRGYESAESAKAFLRMESEMLENPFKMKDIEKGIERIRSAVEKSEKITVYGDYDVDGVTSVCTLYLYLKSIGANVEYYIPNRTGEGYGVSNSALDVIAEGGTKLIITVDTGITANDEVLYAAELGIDFIVTDHHECRAELPLATAVINPHRPDCEYPFKELAGVGVVFKLISAYEERVFGKSRIAAAEKIFANYADLVAIGTIADVMPIKSENRFIVKYGLAMIENTKRVGLRALIDAASSTRADGQRSTLKKKRPKITSGYIGYTMAPRINAAGRIKTASMAVELFLTEDEELANEIAEELCRTNRERQAEENKIMQEAYEKIEDYDIESNPVIVLDADTWHHGVIGIVSSRITEKYSRPSILVSFEGHMDGAPSPDDVGKGSGRSIKGINLVDALCHCSEHLVKFGGHELAAGLSVTRGELPSFRKLINEYARSNLRKEDMIPTLEADCEVDFCDVSLSLAKSLQMLEPYGVGNPVPTFMLSNIAVHEISGVSDGKHTRLVIGNGKHTVSAIHFSSPVSEYDIHVGDKVDLLFNLDINEWGGRESLQMIIRDIRISAEQESILAKERERFEQIKSGEPFLQSEDIMPSREDFAAVYKLMLACFRGGIDTLSHRDIIARLTVNNSHSKIGYIKLKLIVMVMKELNIVYIEDVCDEVYKFSIHYSTTKTDLEKSTLLRRLRSQMVR